MESSQKIFRGKILVKRLIMKLRYLTIQNPVNAETVALFASTNQLTKMEAKRLLEDKTTTVLQYWDGHSEEWITVPHIVEYR